MIISKRRYSVIIAIKWQRKRKEFTQTESTIIRVMSQKRKSRICDVRTVSNMYMFTPPAQVSFLNGLAVQTPVGDKQTDTTSFTVAVYPHIWYEISPGSRPEKDVGREGRERREGEKGGREGRKRREEEK